MREDKKENIKDEFEFSGSYQKKYDNIKNLLQSAINQVEKVKNAIENLEKEERKSHYQGIPGTEGVFDGQYLIAEDGRKTEVPANYAAKSKLVYGDILKVFTDGGKQIFKQIDRVERKKIEGIMAKKEGRWYLLSDTGSYRVSDVSADYNKAELNDRAVAFIPAENPKVSFAALDRVYKEGIKESSKDKGGEVKVKKDNSSQIKPKLEPESKKPKEKKKNTRETSSSSKEVKKPAKNAEKEVKKESTDSKEYIDNIMDEDDLR